MYKLTVVKTIPNEHFKEQMEYYNNQRNGWDQRNLTYPTAEIEVKHLEVTITDEEFAAIKKAVLEVA